MIRYTTGNLLDAEAEALVNTVNTVGVMGKGIALMFKEAFPENFKAYEAACERGEVVIGKMFVTRRTDLLGPKWIINFPTKKHWRHPSKLAWIQQGLADLKRVIRENGIKTIALPPLGAGNGGLEWGMVKSTINAALTDIDNIEVIVFEPTAKYQNVAKRTGVEKLTPARALVAELVRRYSLLGIECTLLEVQKLAWFLERSIEDHGLAPLKLKFEANKFGPYADNLRHLLDGLDGSYLHCDKRIADAQPLDSIWFEESKRDFVAAYLKTEGVAEYAPALEATSNIIDGFESPLGMELLATVDWLLRRDHKAPTLAAIQEGIRSWTGGIEAAQRKEHLFDERLLGIALDRLASPA